MHGEYVPGEVAPGETEAWSDGSIAGPSTSVLDNFNRGALGPDWTANVFGAAGGGGGGSNEFTNGFEEGDFSAWSITYTAGTGSNSVTTGSKQSGTYGYRSEGTTNTNWRYQAGKNFTTPANNKSFARFYVYPVSISGSGVLRIGGLYKENPVFNRIASIHYDNGSWFLNVRNLDTSETSTALSAGLTVGAWNEVEVSYDASGANPVTTVWLNNTQVATYTDTSSGTLNQPDRVTIGGHETSWGVTADLYFDDVQVSDDRIGGGLLPPAIVSNELAGAVTTESNAWLNVASYSGDVDSFATIPALPPSGEYVAIAMAVAPGATTTDAYQLTLTQSGTLTLYRITDGAMAVTLGQWVTGLGAGDRIWLRRNTSTGAMQVAYKLGANGWIVAALVTDATHTGTVYLAVVFVGTTARLDDLGGGESVGGTPTYTGDIVATAPTPEADVLGLFTPPTYAGLIDALAPTPDADLAGAHVPPTYAGDIVATAPTPVAELTGSYTQPLYTADIAAVAPLPSADLTGAHVPPAYAGDIAATVPTPTAEVVGAFTPALYTADIVATVPTPTAEIVGAHVPPSYSGDISATAPTPIAILDGSHVPPVYTADIVATAPMPGAVLVGDQLPPAYVASVDVLLPLPVAELIGTFAGELYSAVIVATVPTPSAEVTGSYTQPIYAADIAATAPLPTADLAGTHTPPVYAGDIVATAPLPTADVVGSFAGALYSGEISATAPLPVVVVTGAQVPPSYAGDVSAVAPTPVAVVNGSFAAPVYSADIVAVVPLPDAVASGLFSAPTYVGDIVAMAPMPSAELTGSYSTFVAPLVVRITRKMLARFMAKRMPV